MNKFQWKFCQVSTASNCRFWTTSPYGLFRKDYRSLSEERNRVLKKFHVLRTHTDNLSVAKGLKLPDLILSFFLLLKTNIGYETFFSLIMWWYVIFKFWATLEFVVYVIDVLFYGSSTLLRSFRAWSVKLSILFLSRLPPCSWFVFILLWKRFHDVSFWR